MPSPTRMLFASSSPIALPCLHTLIESPIDVVAVYTQPDRPSGRGRTMQANAIKQAAEAAGIAVHQPIKLDPEACATWASHDADLAVVLAYGLLLPEAALQAPRKGCLNIHFSLLPRWRGASPIQAAILHGDTETGIAFMQMDRGLDTGPVYQSIRVPLDAHTYSGALAEALGDLAASKLLDACQGILEGSLQATPQSDEGITHAGKITKQDGRIDWTQSATCIARRVRAFNPWPVCFCEQDGALLRIWEAEACPEVHSEHKPGTIIATGSTGITVACGNGALRITNMQLPNKRRMPVHALLNAHHARFNVGALLY